MTRGIAFTQYQRGENEHEYPGGTIREVWSGSWHQTFQDVGLSEGVQRTLYQHRISGNWNGAEFPSWDDISDEMLDIMIWFADDDQKSYGEFSLWLSHVVQNGKNGVGGDDSYFDYYPDQFHVADQIAKQMSPKWEARVQEAKKAVYDLGMYHDEDAINHGYPLGEVN